jgi:hypothetical protein
MGKHVILLSSGALIERALVRIIDISTSHHITCFIRRRSNQYLQKLDGQVAITSPIHTKFQSMLSFRFLYFSMSSCIITVRFVQV